MVGRVLTALRQHVGAFEALQQAVYRNGNNAMYWCAIGVLYFQINQPRDALDAYLRAIRLNPNLSEVFFQYIFIISLTLVSDIIPLQVWFDLGTLYESCGQLPDALDAYQHAGVNDPNNRPLHERIQRITEILAQKGIAPPPLQSGPGGRIQALTARASNANFTQGSSIFVSFHFPKFVIALL